MTTLMQAHRQWSSRAPDERFTSLPELQSFKRRVRAQSHSHVISSRKLAIEPTPDGSRRDRDGLTAPTPRAPSTSVEGAWRIIRRR